MEKIPPPYQADEVDTLRAFLDYYRATLLHQCEGLDSSQLNTWLNHQSSAPARCLSMPPSVIVDGWSRVFNWEESSPSH